MENDVTKYTIVTFLKEYMAHILSGGITCTRTLWNSKGTGTSGLSKSC